MAITMSRVVAFPFSLGLLAPDPWPALVRVSADGGGLGAPKSLELVAPSLFLGVVSLDALVEPLAPSMVDLEMLVWALLELVKVNKMNKNSLKQKLVPFCYKVYSRCYWPYGAIVEFLYCFRYLSCTMRNAVLCFIESGALTLELRIILVPEVKHKIGNWFECHHT